MLNYIWVIPNILATSSIPTEDDVDKIVSLFKSVIPLVEEREFKYDPEVLKEKGVYVYHIPIPDSSTPNLIVLHEVIDFISKCEKPVLIHCCGGCGRSGTVVTAYLMSTEGLKYEEALIKARSINPCFVESEEQHRVLRLYDRLLGAVPTVLLSKVIEIGKNFRFGRGVGHVSKVLELSVELVSELEHYNLLSLKTDVERTLYIAAILHDIGVYKGFSSHKVYMS